MIRLCFEVLGFFLFLMLLVNVGNAQTEIEVDKLQAMLLNTINKAANISVTVVKPTLDEVKIKQL